MPSSMARRTASRASGASRSISRRPASARKKNMPAFQRQPSAMSAAASAASGFSTKRSTAWAPAPIGCAVGDVAVGGGGLGRGDAEDDDPAVLGGAGGGGDGAVEGGGVGDQVVRRHHEHDRLRVAPRGEAGGERHRGQGVAALGLERDLDRLADLGGLVGDQEARGGGADHDRLGEERALQPPERALERRGAAEDRHVLLGEVLARHRPEPRARAAAEDRRHDQARARGVVGRGERGEGRHRRSPFGLAGEGCEGEGGQGGVVLANTCLTIAIPSAGVARLSHLR